MLRITRDFFCCCFGGWLLWMKAWLGNSDISLSAIRSTWRHVPWRVPDVSVRRVPGNVRLRSRLCHWSSASVSPRYIHHFEIKMHNTQVVKVEVNKIFSSWWICSHSIMRKVLMPPAFPHCSSTLQLPLEKRLKEQLFFEARGDSPERKARHGWPWMAGLKICFGLLVIGMCPLFPEGCDQWWQGLVGSWSRGEQSEDWGDMSGWGPLKSRNGRPGGPLAQMCSWQPTGRSDLYDIFGLPT